MNDCYLVVILLFSRRTMYRDYMKHTLVMLDEFKELYEKYERATSIKKKKVSAMDLFSALIKERAETGRIYIMNVDHCNTHSSFKDKVYMSNLCQEITLPTKPLNHIDDEEGEIALCILHAINVGT